MEWNTPHFSKSSTPFHTTPLQVWKGVSKQSTERDNHHEHRRKYFTDKFSAASSASAASPPRPSSRPVTLDRLTPPPGASLVGQMTRGGRRGQEDAICC